jgi:hypothetical protein
MKITKSITERKKESVNEVKKGSIVIPFAHGKDGEFIVDKVFKNKDGETSYTGKFKKSGKKKEFILHKKDKIVEDKKESIMKLTKADLKEMIKKELKEYKDPEQVAADLVTVVDQFRDQLKRVNFDKLREWARKYYRSAPGLLKNLENYLKIFRKMK